MSERTPHSKVLEAMALLRQMTTPKEPETEEEKARAERREVELSLRTCPAPFRLVEVIDPEGVEAKPGFEHLPAEGERLAEGGRFPKNAIVKMPANWAHLFAMRDRVAIVGPLEE